MARFNQYKIEELKKIAPPLILTRAKKRGYICPICNSGTGAKKTGIETKDNIHFTCFAGECFTNSDIFDIVGKMYNISEYREQVEKVTNLIGTNLAQYEEIDNNSNDALVFSDLTTTEPAITTEEQPSIYKSFIYQANEKIEDTTYHRGLSLTTLKKYKIGYEENWIPPNKPNISPTARLIIPTGAGYNSYLARAVNNDGDYSKMKVGKVDLFNPIILDNLNVDIPLVVAEGEIDALSLLDCGLQQVIGLGSTSNISLFKGYLEKFSSNKIPPILIALDNDTAGEKAGERLLRELQPLNISVYIYKLATGYKDINEKLMTDKAGLIKELKPLIDNPRGVIEQLENTVNAADLDILNNINAQNGIEEFKQKLISNSFIEPIKTGFTYLDDKILEGGLYAGLYILGALSSLGKTTFCLQVAEQIARAGTDVLFFSLEMSRLELLAKLVSKETYINTDANNRRLAKTTRGVLSSVKYLNYSTAERNHIDKALDSIGRLTNLYIEEGGITLGVKEIKNKIEQHIRIKKKAPVVFIDYLQILTPIDSKGTDKQNTDENVKILKQISRDYNIPVVAISSFNRENYNSPVNMASFKESGAIEYSSDILIGLQYKGMDGNLTDECGNKLKIDSIKKINEERARNGNSILVELKILKNRNGSKGGCDFDFIPMFNYYSVAEEQGKTRIETKNNNISKIFKDIPIKGHIVKNTDAESIFGDI